MLKMLILMLCEVSSWLVVKLRLEVLLVMMVEMLEFSFMGSSFWDELSGGMLLRYCVEVVGVWEEGFWVFLLSEVERMFGGVGCCLILRERVLKISCGECWVRGGGFGRLFWLFCFVCCGWCWVMWLVCSCCWFSFRCCVGCCGGLLCFLSCGIEVLVLVVVDSFVVWLCWIGWLCGSSVLCCWRMSVGSFWGRVCVFWNCFVNGRWVV